MASRSTSPPIARSSSSSRASAAGSETGSPNSAGSRRPSNRLTSVSVNGPPAP